MTLTNDMTAIDSDAIDHPIATACAPAHAPAPVGRVLVAAFAYNEGVKIQATVDRTLAALKRIGALSAARNAAPVQFDMLVMDDGSTDGSLDSIRALGVRVISSAANRGIGSAMKEAFQLAIDDGYDVIIIMAGNNKDDPEEIGRLLDPIVRQGFDFVQGSRWMKGGGHGRMPIYRRFATRLHPFLFSLATRKWVTESTNGFRAIRTRLLRDERIRWRQAWLDKYELEPYLLFKAIRLGYRHTEVPVVKIYPPKKLGYTKMKPLTGWWSILRPIFYLGLRIRK
jgi:dolichol-phosphate mannosyltransferase